MSLTLEERVANGARWLDENFAGWESRIDTYTLVLSDKETCICGQVFSKEALENGYIGFSGATGETVPFGYDYAEQHLFQEANSWILSSVPKNDPTRARQVSFFLGFDLEPNSSYSYEELQEAWVDLLAQRGL